MPRTKPFLSYGHDNHAPLVHQIPRDLEEGGYEG